MSTTWTDSAFYSHKLKAIGLRTAREGRLVRRQLEQEHRHPKNTAPKPTKGNTHD